MKSVLHLSAFIEQVQARGRRTFSREEAIESLNATPSAFQRAAYRLRQRGSLISPRQGFFVVVPVEYRAAGAPPPLSFIDSLMLYQANPYYVGLLTAAALHGAAHQASAEFQVMVESQAKPIVLPRATMRFFVKRHLAETPTVEMNGDRIRACLDA